MSKHLGVELRGLLKKTSAVTGCSGGGYSQAQRYSGRDCQPGTLQYT
jgi:hypothetical protein